MAAQQPGTGGTVNVGEHGFRRDDTFQTAIHRRLLAKSGIAR
jgi:hypothetical protein